MELTPQSLHDVEFREARRGGYNTRDVDDFLERLAVGVAQLQDRLREAYHRAEAAEGRLAEMQRQLDELQRRGPADNTANDADETLRRTLVLAQRTADATIKEAKDEANRLLAEARDEVAQARASAESEAHRDARAELDQLSADRDVLLADIETLERHVDEQRNRIRDGIDDLQKVLDDPSSLRTEPAPEVSEVKPPARPEPVGLGLSGNGSMAPPVPSAPPPVPAPAPAPASPNGGYGNSPFAGVDFKHLGNGAPADEPAASLPSSPSSVFDTPGFVSVPPPPPPPSSPAPPNDGSMVGALQELHSTPPPPEPPLPGRDDIRGLDLPSRDPLPSRGEGLSPLDPLPARGEAPPRREPPLPSRDIVPGREPLPSRDIVPGREPLPSRDPLPSRGDGFSPHDPLPSREGMPPRDREPLPTREAAREPLPMRDANREPLPVRNAVPPTEPIAVPGPGQPGSTGFLPDLNAVFNPGPAPEPPPVDDLPLPIDAPPPPPPPSGFDHLQDHGNIPVEPGSRPSEWGRGVFDADDEFSSDDQHPRAPFGRRG